MLGVEFLYFGQAMAIAGLLKKLPGVLALKRAIYAYCGWGNSDSGYSLIPVLKAFPAFAPNSAGQYRERSRLTLSTIQNIFPTIENLIHAVSTTDTVDLIELEDPAIWAKKFNCFEQALNLGGMFDHYGSDKAKVHDYHFVYSSLLGNPDSVRQILEVGLGTNNPDVVSNMGIIGRPGASLRAFRDYCKNAQIYGADIDTRILFNEDRIFTYHVDQLSLDSLEKLSATLPRGFDLIIDDGLHSPDANINTLMFGLPLIRNGGWFVVEDIAEEAIPIWRCIAAILRPKNFKVRIFSSPGGVVFAVQKPDV